MIENKEQFFAQYQKETKAVKIPTTGMLMQIEEFSVRDKDDYTVFYKENEGRHVRLFAFVVCRSCPILSDSDLDKVLDSINSEDLEFLATEVLKLSKMIPEDEEELEKN